MKEFLRDYELAHRWGVHRATIWRWNKARIIPPPVRIGLDRTRWALAHIQEYERGQELEARLLQGGEG